MREYLLTLCVAAAVTYLLTGPARKFAIAVGAMPEIRARDVHREPTPRLGGIAMFGGLCAGLVMASQLSSPKGAFDVQEPQALLSGAALIWVIDVLDDKFEIEALVKLGGLLIAAAVMVQQGLKILWLPVPGLGTVLLPDVLGTLRPSGLEVRRVVGRSDLPDLLRPRDAGPRLPSRPAAARPGRRRHADLPRLRGHHPRLLL